MIDYLTLTGSVHLDFDNILCIFGANTSTVDFKPCNRFFYKMSCTLNGATFYFASATKDTEFKWCVQISGSGMSYLTDSKQTSSLCGLYMDNFTQINCSRIDVTRDYSVAMQAVLSSFHKGGTIFKAKKHKLILTDTGDTLYIGSRESDCFIRIYDKMAELIGKKSILNLTRLEFEIKGKKASQVLKNYIVNGDECFNQLFNRYIVTSDVFSVESEEVIDYISTQNVDLVRFIEYMRGQMSAVYAYLLLIGNEDFGYQLCVEAKNKPIKPKYAQMLQRVGKELKQKGDKQNALY